MADIELTSQDRERLEIIRACIAKEIGNAVASARLGLTIRQLQRLKRAVKQEGEAGVVHGNRGKTPHNATGKKTITAVIAFLKKEKHRDFAPTFAMEQLAKQERIVLSRETVRAVMIGNDLWKSKERTGPALHRQWRERRAMYGELAQFDGSYHDWFENGTEGCLLSAIDDATSRIVQAVFDDNEGVHAVFRFWWNYVEAHGLPAALYMDKFSTYKINHKSAVDNAELMTQFERAMDELGVEVIHANSPEAKGRVERLFGTLQDRLVKEMRLADIKNTEDADRFLADTYVPDHNKRFAVPARTQGDAHRPLSQELRKRLPSIFSIHSERTVRNDFTIRFKNQWLQLAATQETAAYPRDTVTIEERLDGSIHIRLKDMYLSFAAINKLERALRPRVTARSKQKPAWKPAANHPWRKK